MAGDDPLPHTVSYASSNRSSCKSCKGAIGMGELRMGVTIQSPHFDGTFVKHMHLKCYMRQKKRVPSCKLEGFRNIRWTDQNRVLAQLREPLREGVSEAAAQDLSQLIAKWKAKALNAAEENALEWRIHDRLLHDVGAAETREQLLLNQQASSGGPLTLYRRLSQALVYGTVPKCPKCSDGILHFDDANDEWVCTDFATAWSRCSFKKEGFSSLEGRGMCQINYTRNRFLLQLAEARGQQAEQEATFLRGLHVVLSGRIGRTKAELVNLMSRLGGVVDMGITKDTTHVLASENTFYKGNSLLTAAQKAHIPVVSESFLDRCIHEGRIVDAEEFLLSNEPKKSATAEQVVLEEAPAPEITAASSLPQVMAEVCAKGENRPHLTSGSRPVVTATGLLQAQAAKALVQVTSVRDLADAEELNPVMRRMALADPSVSIGVALSQSIVDPRDYPATARIDVSRFNPQYADGELSLHTCTSGFVGFDPVASSRASSAGPAQASLEGQPSVRAALLAAAAANARAGEEKKAAKKQRKMEPGGRFSMLAKKYVDPEAGTKAHHIMEEGERLYDVVLNQTSVAKGNNSYYKMQLLVPDSGKGTYYVWTKWGRVGTTVGASKLAPFTVLAKAVAEFENKFYQKSKNRWRHFLQGAFTKYGGAYQVLDIEYEEEEEESSSGSLLDPSIPSALDPRVQQLVRMLFNKDIMVAAMKDMRLDTAKMPLGKLSKALVRKGYSVLQEVEKELSKDQFSRNTDRLVELSSMFYTLIPHSFGKDKPPVLDSKEKMKERMDMLEMLADLEIAAGLLGEKKSVGPMNPIDAQYLQLGTDLLPLEDDCQAVRLVRDYVHNTHSKLHSNFRLEVEHVFAVQRSGEEEAFSKFQCLRNKRLLWHGSRLSNFAGIISQGLRIAPPEAPHSGYMFGKGVYFADMVSKSATYCHPHLSANKILMLISEVALGEMNEEAFAKYLTKEDLDSLGRHSTKGLGRLAPAPTGDKVFDPHDDTVLPLGKEASTGVHNCELEHNEYIVYDTRQVRQRFLVQLRYVDH